MPSAIFNLHVRYFQIKVKQSNVFMGEIATLHSAKTSTELLVLIQERSQSFQEHFNSRYYWIFSYLILFRLTVAKRFLRCFTSCEHEIIVEYQFSYMKRWQEKNLRRMYNIHDQFHEDRKVFFFFFLLSEVQSMMMLFGFDFGLGKI